MNAMETYTLWLDRLGKQSGKEESRLYRELLSIREDEAEITERFYREIEFGTAGLRGICGAGTNRMNELTVGRATQGIAAYILQSGEDPAGGVVIAYDCRHYSKEFSELAAEIFAGNGIRVYLFPSLRPTPELSYAIRKLGAVSGVNMTASHNPREYNGYKVYWKDGAQISGEVSDGMLDRIKELDMFDAFRRIPLEEAERRGLVTMLGEEMDRGYLAYVLSLAQRPDEELDLSVPVVYTPLNGAGSVPMMEVAAARGFTGFHIVAKQKDPDPDFTTVPYPNPEDPETFALAEELGKETGAEVLIATDPDADRMAIEAADGRGGYVPLNGNQTGALLIAYLAASQKEHGTLPAKAAMIKSIVTGNFGKAICEDYGIRVCETLTGFKNICGKIPDLEKEGYTCFFAYEEGIGCAPGTAVRDKDGIAAGMLVAEIAAFYRKRGMGLLDALEDLYKKYGYYAEDQVSVVLEGKAGQERIGRIMDALRRAVSAGNRKPGEMPGAVPGGVSAGNRKPGTVPAEAPAGNRKPGEVPAEVPAFRLEIAEVIDYLHGWKDIPPQNALKIVMEDGSWFAARPSGTEPKIKFYYYAVHPDKQVSLDRVSCMKKAVNALISTVE